MPYSTASNDRHQPVHFDTRADVFALARQDLPHAQQADKTLSRVSWLHGGEVLYDPRPP